MTPNVFDGLGESFSVEAWIRHPNPADGSYKPFLTRHPGANLGNEASEFTFQIQRDGNINFFTGCGNYWQYGFQIGLQSPQFPLWRYYTLQANVWTHVAATVDWRGDYGIVTLYVNGNLIDQKPWGSNDQLGVCTGRLRSRAIGQPVRIGYYDNSDNGVQTFGGEIDEVRIWNSVRTQQEIQNHMHGLFFNKSSLVAYFGFSEAQEGIFPTQARRNLLHSFNQGLSQFPCASGAYDVNTMAFTPLPWGRSGLKIHNAPIVTTLGAGAASGSLFGVDMSTPELTSPVTFDYWITGLLFATDATAWYNNNGVRTQLLPPFPILVPSLQQIEYQPGTRAGYDIILYMARSKTTGVFEAGYSPGTNSTTDCCHGNTKMSFLVRCPPGLQPDRCGVCGGDNTTFCPCYCNAAGDQENLCKVCGSGGPDCRGCDCIAFSGATADCCGICGGPNVNSTTMVDCPNTLCRSGPGCPRIDACGVCGGDNSTCQCTSYKGVPVAQMDFVLLESSLDAILVQIALVDAGIKGIDASLPASPTTISNLALAQEILQANEFCGTSSVLTQQLALLVGQLEAYSGGPCGPVPVVPCSEQDVFF